MSNYDLVISKLVYAIVAIGEPTDSTCHVPFVPLSTRHVILPLDPTTVELTNVRASPALSITALAAVPPDRLNVPKKLPPEPAILKIVVLSLAPIVKTI